MCTCVTVYDWPLAGEGEPEGTHLLIQRPGDGHQRSDVLALGDEQVDHVRRAGSITKLSCQLFEVVGAGTSGDWL